MLKSKVILLVLAFTALLTLGATADEWVAERLRGGVFAYVGETWVQLERGDVVPDDRVIRTQNNGRVTFVRDAEVIEVGPNSQIQIMDKSGRRYTTVRQFYGTVEIEAEVQNVQHFGVRTPYLAAVVKGTKFAVSSDNDSSEVEVSRGQVAVENFATDQTVLLTAGQSIDSGDFVARTSDGLPVLNGVTGVPDTTFAGLGGGDPTVLQDLLNGSGGDEGISLELLLGGAGGVDLSLLGGDGGIADLGVELGGGGVTVDLGVGTGGLLGGDGSGQIVDLGVGAGGVNIGASVGGEGVSVTTPLGGVNVDLGGLLGGLL